MNRKQRRAIRRKTKLDPYHALAVEAFHKGDLELAIEYFEAALIENIDNYQIHNDYAGALLKSGYLEGAAKALRKAVELKPDAYYTWNNLGTVLRGLGKISEALEAFRKSAELEPKKAQAYNNLAATLMAAGQMEEGIKLAQRTCDLDPQEGQARSNLIFMLDFQEHQTTKTLQEARRLWSEKIEAPLRKYRKPHLNLKTQDRKLRIGYVSADFYRQSLASPLLQPAIGPAK